MGFLYLPDTPRYLATRGREDEARLVLGKVYSGDEEWVQYEMDEINDARKEEEQHKKDNGSEPETVAEFRIFRGDDGDSQGDGHSPRPEGPPPGLLDADVPAADRH